MSSRGGASVLSSVLVEARQELGAWLAFSTATKIGRQAICVT